VNCELLSPESSEVLLKILLYVEDTVCLVLFLQMRYSCLNLNIYLGLQVFISYYSWRFCFFKKLVMLLEES
jgi:hypothetical protein